MANSHVVLVLLINNMIYVRVFEQLVICAAIIYRYNTNHHCACLMLYRYKLFIVKITTKIISLISNWRQIYNVQSINLKSELSGTMNVKIAPPKGISLCFHDFVKNTLRRRRRNFDVIDIHGFVFSQCLGKFIIRQILFVTCIS